MPTIAESQRVAVSDPKDETKDFSEGLPSEMEDQDAATIPHARNEERALQDHIAGHLETLALLSLPANDKMDSEAAESKAVDYQDKGLEPVRPATLLEAADYFLLMSRGTTDGTIPDLSVKFSSIWEQIQDEIMFTKPDPGSGFPDPFWSVSCATRSRRPLTLGNMPLVYEAHRMQHGEALSKNLGCILPSLR